MRERPVSRETQVTELVCFIVLRGLVPRIRDCALSEKIVDGQDSAVGRPGHDLRNAHWESHARAIAKRKADGVFDAAGDGCGPPGCHPLACDPSGSGGILLQPVENPAHH